MAQANHTDQMADKRVLIASGNMAARERLKGLVAHGDGWRICGEPGNHEQTLRQIEHGRPDLLILDIDSGEMRGLELVREVMAMPRRPPILLVSMCDERPGKANNGDILINEDAAMNILDGIRIILRCGSYMNDAACRKTRPERS